MTTNPAAFPRSIAIAGAWGYIGRRFLDVALKRGLTTFVHDPGPLPADVDPSRITRVDADGFDRADAEVFHLAVHPEHRRLGPLFARGDRPLLLVEKPMAEPERPDGCREVVEAADAAGAAVFYDFPELYDPITSRIVDRLNVYRRVELTEVFVQRSKDREDPANPRNAKRMVPIQYQESGHCLAFVLHVLGAAGGVGARGALAGGVRFEAESSPYDPPNPEAYPYVVDGRCRFSGEIGGVRVTGLTDFKRGAPWAKYRRIRGLGDGRPFEIEASYLEGNKSLRFDGEDQPCDPSASSYEAVLATTADWSRRFDRPTLMTGPFPNPRFARLVYQLSAALWRGSRTGGVLAFPDADRLEAWDAGFAEEAARFPRYRSVSRV